jgi:hypothetical protein
LSAAARYCKILLRYSLQGYLSWPAGTFSAGPPSMLREQEGFHNLWSQSCPRRLPVPVPPPSPASLVAVFIATYSWSAQSYRRRLAWSLVVARPVEVFQHGGHRQIRKGLEFGA